MVNSQRECGCVVQFNWHNTNFGCVFKIEFQLDVKKLVDGCGIQEMVRSSKEQVAQSSEQPVFCLQNFLYKRNGFRL